MPEDWTHECLWHDQSQLGVTQLELLSRDLRSVFSERDADSESLLLANGATEDVQQALKERDHTIWEQQVYMDRLQASLKDSGALLATLEREAVAPHRREHELLCWL